MSCNVLGCGSSGVHSGLRPVNTHEGCSGTQLPGVSDAKVAPSSILPQASGASKEEARGGAFNPLLALSFQLDTNISFLLSLCTCLSVCPVRPARAAPPPLSAPLRGPQQGGSPHLRAGLAAPTW